MRLDGAAQQREVGPVAWGVGRSRSGRRSRRSSGCCHGARCSGEHPLDLPERVLPTTAVWWTCDEEALLERGVASARLPGATHAAEHLATALLPLVATCDRWDVGATSAARHPDTGRPTVLVHDAQPGGAGFARRGFEAGATWLAAAGDVAERCACEDGCPGCVQSPSCPTGNDRSTGTGLVLLRLATGATRPVRV